jgi:F420-dependent oxidoreductase-like protein
MDHFFALGPDYRDPMLEAYTALGFIAACTSRIRLGCMVTGVTYRHPGVLIKQATTLNVLSKGRGWFGIGAAWFEKEHHAFGVEFPPLKERFERLEETLKLAHQAWSGNAEAFKGKYYQLEEPLLSPVAVSQPRPRILIGGSGEQKTLRLVAQYGDACHVNAPDLDGYRHKLEVLDQHCQRLGRDPNDIERTAGLRMTVEQDGSNVDGIVKAVSEIGEVGYDMVTMALPDVYNLRAIKLFGERVIPRVASVGTRSTVGSGR